MKRFTFTLERMATWRRLQRDQECANLEKLFTDRSTLDQQRDRIGQQREEMEKAIAYGAFLDASTVTTLPQWQKHTIASLSAISGQRQQLEARIERQQIKVREAERQVKLLERIREGRYAAWHGELLKEEEAFAAEAFLAKCVREKAASERD